jgi:hypothetical protein
MKILMITGVVAIAVAALLTPALLRVLGRSVFLRPAIALPGEDHPVPNWRRWEWYFGLLSLLMAAILTAGLGGAYAGIAFLHSRLILRSDLILPVPIWFWFMLAAFAALPLAALIGHRWLFPNLLGRVAYGDYCRLTDARHGINGQRLLSVLTLLMLGGNFVFGSLALGQYAVLRGMEFRCNAFWSWRTRGYDLRQISEIRRLLWLATDADLNLNRLITYEVVFRDGWIWRSDQGLLSPSPGQTAVFIDRLSLKSYQRVRDVRAFASPPTPVQLKPAPAPAPPPGRPAPSRPQSR